MSPSRLVLCALGHGEAAPGSSGSPWPLLGAHLGPIWRLEEGSCWRGREEEWVQPGVGKTSAVPTPNRPPLPLGIVENIWEIWDKAAPIKSIVLSFLC